MRLRSSLASVLTASVLAVSFSVAPSAAQAYSQVVAFGDSLSDTGNLLARLQPFGLTVPNVPYVDGRFSNGPVAVEVMANALGVTLTSYAYGGALTGTLNQFQISVPASAPLVAGTGMASQVSQYTGSGAVDALALHVVWGGGNDFLVALSGGNLAGLPGVTATAVQNLSNQVQSLYAAGARSFMVPLMPDFATSYLGTSGAYPVAQLSGLSQSFNQALSAAMVSLDAALPGADIVVFNTPEVLAAVRADIAAEGGNVTDRCWSGSYLGQGSTPACTNPDSYFLFDNVHPTARVHASVGLAMAAAVPEPSTWLLLVAGLVCVGVVIWRRQSDA